MTVKDIMLLSATALGEQDACLFLEGKAPSDSDYALETVNLLKRCYDMVTDEIACEFLPLTASERFTVVNGKIAFSSFKKHPIKIISVCDLRGKKCAYKLINDYLSVANGDVVVNYEYRPYLQNESDSALFADTVIGEYVLTHGINAEFCFARGRYGESQKWRDKFISGVTGRINKKSNLKISARSWF